MFGKIPLRIFATSLAAVFTASCANVNDSERFQLGREAGHKFGYIDKSGRFVIQPQFSQANAFNHGIALVRIDHKQGNLPGWTYINRNGKFLVEPIYDDGVPFDEFGVLQKRGRKNPDRLESTVIDASGKDVPWHHPPFLDGFSQGLSAAADDDGQFGYIDTHGHWVIKPQFHHAETFAGGYARADDIIIDKHGKQVFALPRDWVGVDYTEGLFKVTLDDNNTEFLNTSGKVVIPPQKGMDVSKFSDGLALVEAVADGGQAKTPLYYIDHDGKQVLKNEFDAVGPFSEGLAPALKDGKWGFINKSGKFMIAPQFDQVESEGFHEGLVGVCLGDPDSKSSRRFGYIDHTGKFVIKPTLANGLQFSEGLAAAERH